MTLIQNTQIVKYTAQQMYDLVNDVESYPQFMPWCQTACIEKQNASTMTATLELSKGPVHTSFTTHNTLTPDHKIVLNLVKGPFKQLQGVWEFVPLEEGKSCRVSFQAEFSFKNGPLRFVLQPVMKLITENMLQVLIERAGAVYAPH
jgi:ribosome-associated toxin RatA of RatAB toxin-antitoxin module